MIWKGRKILKRDANFENICKIYYNKIYLFCQINLKDIEAAKDCTQEVFMIFYKKMQFLNLSQDIGAWLYKTADFTVKAHQRKDRHNLPLEDVENILSYTIEKNDIKNILTDEEYDIISEYYLEKKSVEGIAQKHNISKSNVYTRLKKIKNKLSKYYTNSTNNPLISLLVLELFTNFFLGL